MMENEERYSERENECNELCIRYSFKLFNLSRKQSMLFSPWPVIQNIRSFSLTSLTCEYVGKLTIFQVTVKMSKFPNL